MTIPEREQTLIGSVQRALTLVDIVADSARPTPVKALAASTGLTPGTTYNLVRTLLHEGYLRTEPDGIVLGPRFPGFAQAADRRGVFLANVRDALNAVTELTGATAYFSRFADGEVQLVDIVDSRRSPRVELWVGLQDSVHATALGKQILAEVTREERLDYLSRHPLNELTPNTISDRQILLAQLEHPGRWMLDREEYAIGHVCVAVPVIAPGITASMAVSIPTEHRDIVLDEVGTQLHGVAQRLALRLGAERIAGMIE